MSKQVDKKSKFLSYVLRHQPEAIGLTLAQDGWVDIDKLILHANQHGEPLDQALIKQIVASSDKQRFTLSEDGLKIRAAQGHSTQQVDINYPEQTPPTFLYHGTATRFMESIKQNGLIAGSRHYVHLSTDEDTAMTVGLRHGKAIVLKVAALQMYQRGIKFYLAENGVWLTKEVTAEYLVIN